LLLLLLKCDAIEVIFKEARRQLRAYTFVPTYRKVRT
jgi:hypothetical protein